MKIVISLDECNKEKRKKYEILIANLVTFYGANYKTVFYKDIVMEPTAPGFHDR